ncbi:MAG: hypothetical protein HY815_14430 [Candidatus Riflebacteria bacterium]|nr:hypothetical protein [Candidatus Riflebacteria bacterium]
MLTGCYIPRARARFVPPGDVERAAFCRLFGQILVEADRPPSPEPPRRSTCDELAVLGFVVVIDRTDRGTFWLVRELEGRERGAGAYLVRLGRDGGPWAPPSARAATPGAGPDARRTVSRAAVQCPHAHSDRLTEVIGLDLFLVSSARAYLQSTVDRHLRGPDGTEADTAHRNDTFFQAATEALDRQWECGVVLQLHGFDAGRHPGAAGRFDALLSDGTGQASPSQRTMAVGRFLRADPRWSVALCGVDTRALAATKNTQGRALNSGGRNLFLHLELSSELRSREAHLLPLGGVVTEQLSRLLNSR